MWLKIGKNRKFPNKKICLWLILYGITFGFRSWYGMTHVGFAQDQARDMLAVEELANQGVWLVGYSAKASVADFKWPPLYYQLLLLIGKISRFHPLGMQWLIIGLESLTPLLLFSVFKKYLDWRYSLGLTLMYIFSPLTTIFSSFNWNPNLIPFFSVLTIFSLEKYYSENKPQFLILGTAVPLIAAQLHFQAALIVPPVLMTIVYMTFKRYLDWKYVLVGLGIALLTYTGYLSSEIKSQWHNTLIIWNYFTKDHAQVYERVDFSDYIIEFIPGFIERVLLGENTANLWLGRSVFGAGIIFLIIQVKEDKKWFRVLLMVISVILMIRVYHGDKLDYYLSAIFFLPYVLLMPIFKYVRKFSYLVAVMIIIWGVKFLTTIPVSNGLKEINQAADFIQNQVGTGPVELKFSIKDVENVFIYGLKKRKIEIKTGADKKVFVCSSDASCGSTPDADELVLKSYKVTIPK